jgi:recombination protein RecT
VSNFFNDINLNGPSILDDPEKTTKQKVTIIDEPNAGLSLEALKSATETKIEPVKKDIQAKKIFSSFVNSDAIQKGILNCFSDKDKKAFSTSIISLVSQNQTLQECTFETLLSSAMVGHSLGFSLNPSIGQCYVVPYNDFKNKRKVATFQIGYKGYIQLAIRSGIYRKINCITIKEGEFIRHDLANDEIIFIFNNNEEKRLSSKTIGYYAMFEHLNGFKKEMYWSCEKMKIHASKFSLGFSKGTGYTFWEKDFDSMGLKTMLRQLLSKWGSLSIEMADAMTKDLSFEENGIIKYPDNDVKNQLASGVIFNQIEDKNEKNNDGF